MNLRALLDKKNIILNLNVESKKRLMEFFANRLASSHSSINEDQVLKSLYQRERIGATYIGKNIYIPHCRVDGLTTTRIIIVTLKNSYYDDTVNDDIKIVVGVFFPYKTSEIHTELLKQLASFLKKAKTQKHFEEAECADVLHKLITKEKNDEESTE
jgi:PTS system nitrogen regulatory IIA component